MRFSKVKDLKVSQIALGTWAMGGGRDWGATEEKDALATVAAALDAGINTIDCAPIYGLGASETFLGKALKGKRQNVVLTTKCGLISGPRAVERNSKADSITKEIESSLTRLQTDYIDIYFIHWPDRNTPLEETLGAMQKLKEQGKIRHIGVSNFDAKLLEQAAGIAEIACVQNEYSFLSRQSGEDVFPLCKKHNIAFFAYGPLCGGILSGRYKKEPNLARNDARSFFYQFYKGDKFIKAQNAVQNFETVAQQHNGTTVQAAINWTLYNKNVTCALAGARRPQHIKEAAAAADWQLTKEDAEFLENEYN